MAISPENENFIDQVVSLGLYGNRDEALDAGVQLLRQRQQLRDTLARGRQQLDEGDYEEFDPQGLRTYFEDLKQRALGRANSRDD